jgi:hypothetical protein
VTGSRYLDYHRYLKAEIPYHYYAMSEWNRYIRGNEYIPLLESRQLLAEQGIDTAIRKLVTDSDCVS